MSSSGVEMDQTTAQTLFFEGGTLIILNIPSRINFGIDLKSWNIAENFKGIKMIPPGFHCIHYSAIDEFGEEAPRVSFFHIFKKEDFVVKQWDQKEEEISPETVLEDTVQKLKYNMKELDRFLAPYPYDTWKQWNELTNKIDASLIERCAPICGVVRSALELEHCSDAARPRGGFEKPERRRRSRLTDETKEEELLPHLKPKPGTELRLSEIPERPYPDGATPTEITKHSLDSSYTLDVVLNRMQQPMEIIGELQLAYICLLCGQSLDAFEHWKKLVAVLCGAYSAIPARRAIYMEFLKTIEVQLSYIPEDILWDIVANNNFVYQHLRNLFANIELNPEVDGRLKSYATRLCDRLSKKFTWNFSGLQEDAEDEAPVVVSME